MVTIHYGKDASGSYSEEPIVIRGDWLAYTWIDSDDPPQLWLAHLCKKIGSKWIMCVWKDYYLTDDTTGDYIYDDIVCSACNQSPPSWATALVKLSG